MLQAKNNTNLLIFISLILIFILTGLIFIYSSSSVYALEKFGTAHYFVKKQLLGFILGIIGLIIFRYLPINFVKSITPYAFWSTLLLTLIPTISSFGKLIHGSSRWLNLYGFVFQPSEFLKIAFIVYISYLLTKKKYKVTSLSKSYIPLLFIVGITSLVLLKQPDFGQTVTLCVTAFILFFIAECQTVHILATLGMLLPIAVALICFKPYRLKRILTFLNPWEDPLGSGFQIIQSLIAIGSGHITGVGIAQSKQKFFYLPMQCTDFIFSIIAEETGFLGSTLLILLYIAFLYTGIKIAQNLNDPFAHFSTLGFVFLISLQSIINLFVVTGLIPTKGLGLPFISYGNSALISNLCMVGLIINFVHNDKEYSAF